MTKYQQEEKKGDLFAASKTQSGSHTHTQIAQQVYTHSWEHTQTQYAVRTMSTDTTRSLIPHSLPCTLYLQRYNELCCTVLFTPTSYQQYSSTEAANWRGQATVLPVPCSGVGVYRHAPSTFLSRLGKSLGLRQAASQNNKTHSHAGTQKQDELAITHHDYKHNSTQVIQHEYS